MHAFLLSCMAITSVASIAVPKANHLMLSERATPYILQYQSTNPGEQVQNGTDLAILTVGDSITVGYLSDQNGGDGTGYRNELKKDLSENNVVYLGTETSGKDGDQFAAWSGKTIQYIADHVGTSLEENPDIILLAAGTNDMNANPSISTEGNDPQGAADRLGSLIDKMVEACPDATILVSIIINTCDPNQSTRTKEYQALIPDVIKTRYDTGHKVLAVDFTTFSTDLLQDCIHPTNEGYQIMGDFWYDFITQIPKGWVE